MLLDQFLEQTAQTLPDKVALVCGDRCVTYRGVDDAANRLARGLIDMGVSPGDRVLIHLDNSVEAAIAIWGVLKAGAVFVMVNATTRLEKLVYLLNNCQAEVLIGSAKRLDEEDAVWAKTPHLKSMILVGETAKPSESTLPTHSWESLLSSNFATPACPRKRHQPDDVAALIYTSGTTGNPKGVMLTHRNFVSAIQSITSYLRNSSSDVILSVLPLSYGYGLNQWLAACCCGSTLVLERSFAFPHVILDRISAWRVTGFPMVPTLAAMLLQRDLSKYDLSSLRYLTNAGAALTADAMTRLRRQLPHVDLFSMYGLTECLRVSYLSPDEVQRRPASVGKAMPNCEVCIVDESGEPVATNDVGELVVSGPHVMPGYWNDPEASAKRLKTRGSSGEKWLFTGDLFRMDADGFLYWVSRMDDVIKSRGEKVSPREVEEVLLLMPGVAEAVVYGVPDAVLGQAVQATLQLHPDSELTTRDVQAHCRHYLEDFMVPQRIEFRESLPRTLNGKVDKRQLVEC